MKMSAFTKKTLKENPLYPVEECYIQIEKLIDDSITSLYDSIGNYIFQDIDYSIVVSNMPQWIAGVGISSELSCSKDLYEKLRGNTTHPIFGKFLYYYDLCSKVAAIQDRLSAVIMFMRQLYNIIPCKSKYDESQYTSRVRCGGEIETEAHMLLNSVFVAYASIFDIITKVAIEQFEYDKYDFRKYKKMRSSDIIYNKNLKNIDSSLKNAGMLFSEPLVIRKIETFRNEFVHNGPWDLRCSIYNTFVNDEPADVIIYSPDMDGFGNFTRSWSRNKFYSQGNRINFQLPDIIKEATKILDNTILQIATLYRNKTVDTTERKYTEECLKAISEYYKKEI